MFRTTLAALALASLASTAVAGVPGSIIFDPPSEGEPILGLPPIEPGPVLPIEAPIVTKSNFPGFTAFDFARSETCEVYQDRVVITRSLGGLLMTETKLINLEGDVQTVLEQAQDAEVLEEENFLCDGPGTSIVAGDDLVIYNTGGCGSPKKQLLGGAASILRDLAAFHCPKIH